MGNSRRHEGGGPNLDTCQNRNAITKFFLAAARLIRGIPGFHCSPSADRPQTTHIMGRRAKNKQGDPTPFADANGPATRPSAKKLGKRKADAEDDGREVLAGAQNRRRIRHLVFASVSTVSAGALSSAKAIMLGKPFSLPRSTEIPCNGISACANANT